VQSVVVNIVVVLLCADVRNVSLRNNSLAYFGRLVKKILQNVVARKPSCR